MTHIGEELRVLLDASYQIISLTDPWYIVDIGFINAISAVAQGRIAPTRELLRIQNGKFLDSSWKDSLNVVSKSYSTGAMTDVTPPGINKGLGNKVVSVDHPLKPQAKRQEHFVLYPKKVWIKLTDHYKIPYDVAIPRSVVCQAGERWIESHPTKIHIVKPLDGATLPRPLKIYGWLDAKLTPPWVLEKYASKESLAKFANCSKYDLRATFEDIDVQVYWASGAKLIEELQREVMEAYHLNGTEKDVLWLMSPRPAGEDEVSDSWKSLQYPSTHDYDLANEFCDMFDTPVASARGSRKALIADILEGVGIDVFMWSAEIVPSECKVESTTRSLEADGKETNLMSTLPNVLATGGLCGLSNLGNTCYMNSALQCLAHTLPLTRYYITGEYKKDLNQENPLGMGGLLASTYADFLLQLWHPDNPRHVVTPKKLKHVISKFAPNFQGYMQQDSQELLASLLDGLHEDCNKIRKKPYIEAVESEEEKSDQVAAEEAWRNYKSRNESVIVDLFQGQYRSRLECPKCKRVSKTFDPFMYCSLPVPQKRRVAIQVSLLINHGTPTSWPITFPIEVWYREEAMQRLNAYNVRAYLDNSICDFMTNLIEIESNQIQLKICLVLMEFFLKHNPDNPSSSSEELKALYEFLFNNQRFMGAFSRAKDRLSRHSSKSRASPNKLVRALSSDSSGSSDSAGHFASLTTELLQSILKEIDGVPDREILKEEVTEGTKGMRDLSPATMPRVEAADEPINLTGISSLGLGAASVSPRHLKYGSPGLEECLYIRSYMGGPLNGESQRPVLITFSFPLSREQSQLLGCQTMENLTVEFVLNAAGLNASCSEVVDYVVEEVSKKMTDIIDHEEEAYDVLEIALVHSDENDPLILKAALREDQTYRVYCDRDLSETPFVDVVDHYKLALDEAETTLGAQYAIHFRAGSEFLDFTQLKDARAGLSRPVEFLNCHLWKTASLAPIAHFVFPNIKLSRNNLPTGLLMQAYPAPATLSRYNRNRRIHTICTLAEAELSLRDCFEEFVACEQLGKDNMWYCSRCKDHVPALKKMDLWKLPDVLVVHLKRFSRLGRGFGSKIDSLVTFPYKDDDILDLKDFLLEGSPDISNAKYRLFAVDRHFGTLGGGHYTAYIKCMIDKQWRWHHFDDSHVTSMVDSVMDESAYILFYERMGDRFI